MIYLFGKYDMNIVFIQNQRIFSQSFSSICLAIFAFERKNYLAVVTVRSDKYIEPR